MNHHCRKQIRGHADATFACNSWSTTIDGCWTDAFSHPCNVERTVDRAACSSVPDEPDRAERGGCGADGGRGHATARRVLQSLVGDQAARDAADDSEQRVVDDPAERLQRALGPV